MCYWLHVGNHLVHFLCKTIQPLIPVYIVCLLFVKAWSMSIFVPMCKYDTVIKADIHFKIFLWTLSFLIKSVIQPLWSHLSVRPEWCVIFAPLALFHCNLHHKEAPLYQSILYIVCGIRFLVKHCDSAEKNLSKSKCGKWLLKILSILTVWLLSVNLWFLALFSAVLLSVLCN